MKSFTEVKEEFACDIIHYYKNCISFNTEYNQSLIKSKENDLNRLMNYTELIELIQDIINGEWSYMGYSPSDPEMFVEEYYR